MSGKKLSDRDPWDDLDDPADETKDVDVWAALEDTPAHAGTPTSDAAQPPKVEVIAEKPPADESPSWVQGLIGKGREAMHGLSDLFGNVRAEDVQATPSDIGTSRGAGLPGSLLAEGSREPAVQALAQGVAHGTTLGLDQNIPGYGDYVRGEREQAKAVAPGAYEAGDTIGSLMSPANAGKGFKGNVGNALLQGSVRGYSDADPDKTQLQQLGEGVKEGAIDGLTTTALHGLLSAPGAAVDLGQDLITRGRKNRAAATGLYGGALNRMVDNKGDAYVEQLGREIEERGLHKGDGVMGWLPQPADTYLENAKDLKKGAVSALDSSERAISELPTPPRVDMAEVEAGLEELSRRGRSSIGQGGQQQAAAAEGVLDRLGQKIDPSVEPRELPWQEALAQRRNLDSDINWERKGGASASPAYEGVARNAAGNLRSGVADALQEGVQAGTVPEDLADQWTRGRDDYRIGSEVSKAARERVNKEQGNQILSLPAAAGLAAAGGAIGAAGSEDGYQGGGMGALASVAGTQLLKTRGRSALAGMQGAAGRALEGAGGASLAGIPGVGGMIGKAADKVGWGLPQVANATLGDASGWISQTLPTGALVASTLGGGPGDGMSKDALAGLNPQYAQQREQAASRGHMLKQNITTMLQNEPQKFGPFLEQLAKYRDDDEQLAAAAERLARTNSRFTPIYQQLISR